MLRAKIVFIDNDFAVARDNCVMTGKPYQTEKFHKSCLEAYKNGKYLQDAFRTLSAGDREFLLSRTSPEGWEAMFAGDEQDPDY